MQKQRMPLWVLAWFALILSVLVIVLANQDAVDRLLAWTGLERVLYPQGKNPEAYVVETQTQAPTVVLEPSPASAPSEEPAVEAPADPDSDTAEPSVPTPASVEPAPLPDQPNTHNLYFLKVTPEGRQDPAPFPREVPAGSTPLTATLKALLLGPTLQDKAQGARTAIPEGTKLLSVRVTGGRALLSFSAEFENNPEGNEGFVAQLREVVWTCLQFPSVESVQILIEGQYRETLGVGGPAIALPLTRTSGL